MPQQSINPETPIALTMQAQEWNMVVEVLCRSTGFSYVHNAPLIEKIGRQLQEKAGNAGLVTGPRAVENG